MQAVYFGMGQTLAPHGNRCRLCFRHFLCGLTLIRGVKGFMGGANPRTPFDFTRRTDSARRGIMIGTSVVRSSQRVGLIAVTDRNNASEKNLGVFGFLVAPYRVEMLNS